MRYPSSIRLFVLVLLALVATSLAKEFTHSTGYGTTVGFRLTDATNCLPAFVVILPCLAHRTCYRTSFFCVIFHEIKQ